jgi:hypothetical protein
LNAVEWGIYHRFGGRTLLQKEGWLAAGVFIIVMLATVGYDARASKAAEISCSVMTKFAKRHYEGVAEAAATLASAGYVNADEIMAHTMICLADMIETDNDLFKRDRFTRACKPGANVRART